LGNSYDSSNIKILKGLEAVAKRPRMYVGNTDDGSGLHHLLWEVFSNSLDLFIINKCREIKIILHSDDSVEVVDDGEGLPIHYIEGKTFLERVMTELHFTATYDGHAPHTHVGGIHGVGLAVVNALSSYVDVNIYSNGEHYHQKFIKTKPEPMRKIGKTNKSGTSIHFIPNLNFFSNILKYDEKIIGNRLKELCYLNKKLTIYFVRKNMDEDTYSCEEGLASYLKEIEHVNNEIIAVTDEYNGIKVDFAFAWKHQKGHMQSFANNINTIDGGTHVNGLIIGLVKAIKEHRSCEFTSKHYKDKIVKNLVAIIHVNIADPKFGSPTKDRLINETVYEAVKKIVYNASMNEFSNSTKFLEFFDANINSTL